MHNQPIRPAGDYLDGGFGLVEELFFLVGKLEQVDGGEEGVQEIAVGLGGVEGPNVGVEGNECAVAVQIFQEGGIAGGAGFEGEGDGAEAGDVGGEVGGRVDKPVGGAVDIEGVGGAAVGVEGGDG